uniref:H15 domain-containing protein n=1 Tax=Biomphalaria glabrata TaxID=6526 RepID=A0A2C9L429_BIOGL
MGKKEANRSEDKEDVETDRQKGKEDQPTEEDICKAIKYLKDRKGSTITDIRKYLVAEVDKFKDATARKLDAHLKKAASKGVQNGRIAKTRGRFMLASSESGTESSKEQQKETSSKRNRRRRRGKCRVHKTNRRYCSRFTIVAYASDDRQDGEATFATSCREKLGQLEKEKAAAAENSVDGFVGSTLHAICDSH